MNDGEITLVLQRIEQGDPRAGAELLPLVYQELRRLAAAKLARESPGQTLQATALVHEAWLRLGGESQPVWGGRAHFFAAAAEAMRQILVDRARQKRSLKRGGGLGRQPIEGDEVASLAPPEEVVAVHDALDALAAEEPLAADLVKLRYFGGFSIEEAADVLHVSRTSAYRLWNYARVWLRASLGDNGKIV